MRHAPADPDRCPAGACRLLLAIARGQHGDADASAFLDDPGVEGSGQRSDSIMIARVDPKAKTVDLMSFPRDLWVPIMPSGDPERINTAYNTTDGSDGADKQ